MILFSPIILVILVPPIKWYPVGLVLLISDICVYSSKQPIASVNVQIVSGVSIRKLLDLWCGCTRAANELRKTVCVMQFV